jgi:hypothetical protein
MALGISVPQVEFDLYWYSHVESVLWSWESAVCRVEVVLRNAAESLRVSAWEVRQFQMPSFSGELYLPELEVVDLHSSGLEGIRYELVSQFDRSFRLFCGDLLVSYGNG